MRYAAYFSATDCCRQEVQYTKRHQASGQMRDNEMEVPTVQDSLPRLTQPTQLYSTSLLPMILWKEHTR